MKTRALIHTLILALLCLCAIAHADRAGAGAALEDFSTPRRTMAFFLGETDEGRFDEAAKALSLRQFPRANREAVAPELARELRIVLDRKLSVDLIALSDDAEGDPSDGERIETIGTIPLETEGISAPVNLARLRTADGDWNWAFAPETVALVPHLYDLYGPSLFESYVPPLLRERVLEVALWQWIGLALAIVVSSILGSVATRIALRTLAVFGRHTRVGWDEDLPAFIGGPLGLFLGLLIVWPLLQMLNLAANPRAAVVNTWRVLLILAIAWALKRLADLVARELEHRAMEGGESDALRRRGIRTQVAVLRRVAHVIVGVFAGALILTQFSVVRTVGMSVLASAGVAGVVIGLAAQKSIGSLLAGIQLSITQPIRIGDKVVVEKEFGTIEDITLTYVVVRV